MAFLAGGFLETYESGVPRESEGTGHSSFSSDIQEWFKQQGRGYQTRMNAVLCSYVEARKKDHELKR